MGFFFDSENVALLLFGRSYRIYPITKTSGFQDAFSILVVLVEEKKVPTANSV
jgi:hypothetical protein